MRELRLVCVLSAVAMGCGGGPPAGHDAGHVDGGPRVDGGPHDGGHATDGGGGRMCLTPPMGMCDLLNDNSCPPGNSCRFLADATGGTPYAQCEGSGTALRGATCSRADMMDECANGLICIDDSCRGYCCNGENTDCELGEICIGIAGSDNVGFCQPSAVCDLVMQTGCPTGQACYPGNGVLLCLGAGTTALGEACEATNACVGGTFCFIAAGTTMGFCRAFCDMTAATPCPDGFMCAGVNGFPTNIGFCEPMAATP